jgi:hypothetical protein
MCPVYSYARNIAFLVEPGKVPIAQLGLLHYQLKHTFENIQSMLMGELEDHEQYYVVPISETLGLPNKERALAAFASAEELLQSAQKDYESLNMDSARQKLNTALKNYENYAAYVDNFESVSRVLVLLGAVALLDNKPKKANVFFQQAATLQPNIEPDPRLLNPNMRRNFAESMRHAAVQATTTLRVDSQPQGAQVFVDNVFMGITPLVSHTLKSGYHFIRIEHAAWRPAGVATTLPLGEETSIKVPLHRCPAEPTFTALYKKALAHLKNRPHNTDIWRESMPIPSLGALLHTQVLMIGVLEYQGRKLHTYFYLIDLEKHTIDRSPTYAFQGSENYQDNEPGIETFLAQTLFQSHLDTLLAHQREKGTLAPDEACLGKLSCEKTRLLIGYGGIGSGTVLLGTGVGFWVYSKDLHRKFINTAQVDTNSGRLLDQGRLFSQNGDILFFTGAAIVLAGGSTLLFWHPGRHRFGEQKHFISLVPYKGGAKFLAEVHF